MVCKISRRIFLERSALVGSGATLYSLTLIGCGPGGGADRGPSNLPGRLPVPDPTPTPTPTPTGNPVPGTTKWRPLRVGAGGFVTGIDIAPDGTKVCRADSSGAYIWDTATNEWRPLITTKSMPAGELTHETMGDTGVYEVCVAPSDSRRIYLAFNGTVYKSVDRGVTFTKTALTKVGAKGNDDYRTRGKRMAIDPVNPDVVIFGSQEKGAFRTTDGGTTWTHLAAIPLAKDNVGILVGYDRTSGTANGQTKGFYVASQGNGIYRTNDAGATFTALPGGPPLFHRMVVDQGGNAWMCSGAELVYYCARGAASFVGINPAKDQNTYSVAINPADVKHVVVSQGGGGISQSFDGGVTWTGGYWVSATSGWGGRRASDIPWLAWTQEDYMSCGETMFDPSQPNKLYFAEGIGVWHTSPPRPPAERGPFAWESQSKGIEQLVSSKFVSPPGGTTNYFVQDRGVFRIDNPDVFPSKHGPNNKHGIIQGYSGDHAGDDPNFIVGIFNWWGKDESGYSVDGGITWTKFASVPADVAAGKISGSIACSTRDNMLWAPSNNGSPYYTKDRGVTWTRCNIPGVPTSGETGWGWAYYLARHIATADKTAPGTFYLYNYLGSSAGVYKSTDGGVNWVRVYSGMVEGWSTFNASMAAVPGQRGHLFFTSGHQSGNEPAQLAFKRSIDGGVNWTSVPNFAEVYCFGFGKAAPGQSYPTIFAAGWYKNEWGLWRSDDNAQSWVKIGDYPLDSFDMVKQISGDMNVYGRCYAGFGGSGAAIADLV